MHSGTSETFAMGKHIVFIDLDVQDMEVRTKDVVFQVYEDGKKFGELRVSRGAVVWRGAYDQIGRKLRWKRFDQLMQDEGRRAERRPPGARTTVRKGKRS